MRPVSNGTGLCYPSSVTSLTKTKKDEDRSNNVDVDGSSRILLLAVQGRNKLAEKKEAEQVALAKARVAEAQGEYDAAKLQAKTKDILSQPKMLKLMELEIEKTYAEGYLKHGNSKYGTNNVYGSGTAVFKGLK